MDKRYRVENREKVLASKKRYREENPEKVSAQKRKCYLAKKDQYQKRNHANFVRRYHNDNDFRMRICLRSRVGLAMRGVCKSAPTLKLLGCTIEELKNHLQKTATSNGYLGFDINNYSGKEYHIDHIIPCCAFKLSEEREQRKCFHWSNLQILSAEDNYRKNDKVGG